MNLYWVEDATSRVAIAARPRGGDWLEDDLGAWKQAGISVVVSALTPEEEKELALELESEICERLGIEFFVLPIEDRSVPTSLGEFRRQIDRVNARLLGSKGVLVHCRAGIGRSSMIAAALLVQRGIQADEAFRRIEKARGSPVPDTDEQRRWICEKL